MIPFPTRKPDVDEAPLVRNPQSLEKTFIIVKMDMKGFHIFQWIHLCLQRLSWFLC